MTLRLSNLEKMTNEELAKKIGAIVISTFLTSAILLLLIDSRGLATIEGVYHRVRKGETLWRISRAYKVDIENIVESNNLRSPNKIKVGQYLFIPGAEKVIRIEPHDSQIRYILHCGTSNRWQYIVIHHSETAKGNARVFDRYHRKQRHFRHGLGYHFVICNGTYRRRDGQIEIGGRWKKQMDGAHCRANNGNRVGIGICLVGNFNKSKPTQKQFDSLVHLASHLCYQYGIPLENIKGHKEMSGAKTDCPGKNFPWKEFREALRERGVTYSSTTSMGTPGWLVLAMLPHLCVHVRDKVPDALSRGNSTRCVSTVYLLGANDKKLNDKNAVVAK